jgi:hypothetical protein
MNIIKYTGIPFAGVQYRLSFKKNEATYDSSAITATDCKITVISVIEE